MAINPVFRGGGQIPDTPSTVQETVNFGLPQAVAGPGNVLDALLKMKMSEQEGARDLFTTLAKTNPQLVQHILTTQPDLLQALVETPRAIAPSRKSLAKAGKPAPSGSLSQRVVAAAQSAPSPPVGQEIPPAQRAALLDFFIPEEATGKNMALALKFESAANPEEAAAAYAALAKAAPISYQRHGLAPEAKSLIDQADLLKTVGLATGYADAITKLKMNPELRTTLMQMQIQLDQTHLAELRRLSAEKGEVGQANLLDLNERALRYNRDLTDAQKDLALLQQRQVDSENPVFHGGPISITPPTTEELKAAQVRIAQDQQMLDDINKLLQPVRAKVVPGKAAAGRKSLDDLVNDAQKPK